MILLCGHDDADDHGILLGGGSDRWLAKRFLPHSVPATFKDSDRDLRRGPCNSSLDTSSFHNLAQSRLEEKDSQIQVVTIYQAHFATMPVMTYEYIQW